MKDKVYVVEGIHDENKLKSIYKDIKTVSVNGSAINKDAINILKQLSKKYEIVLVLDPDYPGTKIRNELERILGNVTHVFFDKNCAISENGKKIGIEHIDDEIIKKTLFFEIPNISKDSNLTSSFLFEIGVIGNEFSKEKREILTNHFHIGNTNGKTLLKRLKWLGLSEKDIIEVLSKK